MSKAEEIIQKISGRITDLTTLKIQTLMGNMEADQQGDIKFKANQDIKGMISTIDLIDGDIKTELSEEFYQKYPELVQFHQSREAKGSEIIEKNILTLRTIITTLFELKDKIS
ncbi:hypothetical protein [Gaoshiqia sediminis]|uniref:Uncharacterized protein n=1 Tax=Gaoshiqia sediminis TaxID=2986998 RepID=A0AA41YDC9_9BACT|nr:hypothetical protein [Gaoshiqia sediminis]MCW0484585.1 hypothetical protein [Gaoshiqia sediminis]